SLPFVRPSASHWRGQNPKQKLQLLFRNMAVSASPLSPTSPFRWMRSMWLWVELWSIVLQQKNSFCLHWRRHSMTIRKYGGIVLDVGALNESLSRIRGTAELIAVGFGGNEEATIPNRKIVEEPLSYDENGTITAPNPRNVEREQGVLMRPTGEPWLSAFDEE